MIRGISRGREGPVTFAAELTSDYMPVMVVNFFRVYPHAPQAALIHFNSNDNF
jgi:hypothetical protein